MNELLTHTNQLLQLNEQLDSIYENVKETGESPDFFETVKPHADQVRDVLEVWEVHVLEWIAKTKPKYFHKQQVENLKENITAVSVQAFFPATSKKRFKELIRSNQYNLESIVQKIETK
ncbi:YppE family protein [Bacillus pinisoli]|uniref:YppE family protein n=1 Tax=Bacillus pinisoli TaxID=2901866 RepID=UPI001FF0FDEB|nr:YppE family protein [Bacillus pinisoli]